MAAGGARIASINTSPGGLPKRPVPECLIGPQGLEGDAQRDLRYHGGPLRAVTLFSLERIEALAREGHPIGVGTIGENLTLSGLDWDALAPGARLRAGAALLEITKYTSPCEKIRESFRAGAFERVSQKLHPGWSRLSASVVEPGLVRVGDPVERVG